ncbi:MAG: hypothetical protein J6X60_01550 [Ruminiclostridium sp.]|nr:hypothetical protein [Ruminiclostridium sp.]
MINASESIYSFSNILLRESGMRYTTEYEIIMKDGEAEVSLYGIKYTGGEDRRELYKRAMCSKETVLDLLNDCRFLSWNGFFGKHPRSVRDGTMFTLDAVVNQEEKIHAVGSENFPEHYRDFVNGLNSVFDNESEE